MAQDLATTTSSRSITFREAEERIEILHSRLQEIPGRPNRFAVPRSQAATTTERHALCAVRSRLEKELAPWTERDHVDVVVTRLMLGFEFGRVSKAEAAIRDGEYIAAVDGLPLWAIHQAAERFRGKTTLIAWDPKWRPTPAQFAEEAKAGLIPLRTKLLHIRRVLEAEVYDPPSEEDRKKVAAAMESFAANRTAYADEADRARPAPTEIAAVREATFRAGVVALRRFDGHLSLGDLMGRLDAKRRPGARA